VFAIEDLIEDETLAVERLVGRWKWPGRSGYVEGVFATLAWVWRRSGVPQIVVERATAPFRLPSMVSELNDSETVLTGLLEDPSALFGVLAQIEALGPELLELRQITPKPHRLE
jgi:hypothetical protein